MNFFGNFFFKKFFVQKRVKSKIPYNNLCAQQRHLSFKKKSSKNIEKWLLNKNFRARTLENNVFGHFGDSPETEKVEKLSFSEIKIDSIYHHFDTILGCFEPQWRLQCTKQS